MTYRRCCQWPVYRERRRAMALCGEPATHAAPLVTSQRWLYLCAAHVYNRPDAQPLPDVDASEA